MCVNPIRYTITWVKSCTAAVKRGEKKGIIPMRMRRLSGLVEHFIRRSSSVMRSVEGMSSKFADEGLAIVGLSECFLCLSFRSEECSFRERERGGAGGWFKFGGLEFGSLLLLGHPNA